MNASPASRLDAAVGRWFAILIGFYQRHLSPLKGRDRACAWRIVHGGESCSAHVRRLMAERGAVAAVPAALQRFRSCGDAARSTGHPTRPWRRGQCCIVLPLPLCSTGTTRRF